MRIIVSYRGIPQSRGWATGDSVCRAIRMLGHEAVPYGRYYHTDEWMGRETEGDLLIWLECNDDDPQYLELLSLRCPRVLWDFDTAMHFAATAELARHFDRVHLANHRWVPRIARASYLPYACDPVFFGPCADLHPPRAAIVGTAFPARVAFARYLDIPIVEGRYREDYVRAISELEVHVHHLDSGGDGLLVGRIWETLAVGTCLLTEDSEDLRRHLQPGTHCEVYADREDARLQLSDLLGDRERTKRIAAAGRQEVLARHTYVHRVSQILEAM